VLMSIHRLMKRLFQKARECQPSIIFIDEIDGFTGTASESESSSKADVRNMLQIEWAKLAHDKAAVMVIGATIHPDKINNACLRLLDIRAHIELPDAAARSKLLKIALRDAESVEHDLSDADFKSLGESMPELSGDDIGNCVQNIGLHMYRRVYRSTHFVEVSV